MWSEFAAFHICCFCSNCIVTPPPLALDYCSCNTFFVLAVFCLWLHVCVNCRFLLLVSVIVIFLFAVFMWKSFFMLLCFGISRLQFDKPFAACMHLSDSANMAKTKTFILSSLAVTKSQNYL